jgi:hypothetical protein
MMKTSWRTITLKYRCAGLGGELALNLITRLFSEQDIWRAFAQATDALNGSALRGYSQTRYRNMTLHDASILFERARSDDAFRAHLEAAGICIQRVDEIRQPSLTQHLGLHAMHAQSSFRGGP